MEGKKKGKQRDRLGNHSLLLYSLTLFILHYIRTDFLYEVLSKLSKLPKRAPYRNFYNIPPLGEHAEH
jgi:hypothetical protein